MIKQKKEKKMKLSIIAVISLTLGLTTFAFAEEKKCGVF